MTNKQLLEKYMKENENLKSTVRGLVWCLENILQDAEPMKGGEQVAIPSVAVKMIKTAIKKTKLPVHV
jgi:hypothetical protein